MGDTTVIEPTQAVVDAARRKMPVSPIGRAILILYMLFFLVSSVMVFSTTEGLSYYRQAGNTWYYLLRQVFTFAIGFVLMIVIGQVRVGWYRRADLLAVVLMVVLLFLTLKFGVEEKGARRALSVFGLFTLRPAELACIPLIVYLANYFSDEKKNTRSLRSLLPPLGVLGVFVGLVVVNSLSQAVVLAVVGGLMLLMGRVRWWQVLLIALLGVGGLAGYQTLTYNRALEVQQRGAEVESLSPDRSTTRHNRLKRWWDGTEPQTELSKMAIANGVVIGKGPGGNQLSTLLPESYSDFIFSIVVEEYGLPGAVLVMGLYGVLLWMIFAVLKASRDRFSQLVCGGVGAAIAVQVLIHMMVGVGMIPVTGITLPLISHGTTSLLVVSILLGLVLSVNKETSYEKV